MKAWVTSIGEPTTNLCVWALERNGFEVYVLRNKETVLAEKLQAIYETETEDFIRVDADVIVNQNCTEDTARVFTKEYMWWMQFQTFDWYKQAPTYGGVQFIKKEALPELREGIKVRLDSERPESLMFRLPTLQFPIKKCHSTDFIMGIHGYGQDDLQRVKETKERRGQNVYDWELVERLAKL